MTLYWFSLSTALSPRLQFPHCRSIRFQSFNVTTSSSSPSSPTTSFSNHRVVVTREHGKKDKLMKALVLSNSKPYPPRANHEPFYVFWVHFRRKRSPILVIVEAPTCGFIAYIAFLNSRRYKV